MITLRYLPRRRPASVARGLVLAIALALASAGCSALAGAGDSTTVVGPVALGAGEHAPALSGKAIDGSGTIDLAAYRGRPVVVNFWASWCVPCRQEFGLFKTALEKHSSEGLAVIGVVFKDDPSPAEAFVRQAGATWPDVEDPGGAIAARYKVVAPPQTYFIDRSGIVRDRQIGQVATTDEMEQLVAEILK